MVYYLYGIKTLPEPMMPGHHVNWKDKYMKLRIKNTKKMCYNQNQILHFQPEKLDF